MRHKHRPKTIFASEMNDHPIRVEGCACGAFRILHIGWDSWRTGEKRVAPTLDGLVDLIIKSIPGETVKEKCEGISRACDLLDSRLRDLEAAP